MSKYYFKHVNSSGFSFYRRRSIWGVMGWVIGLYPGESITIVRSGQKIEEELHKQPDLWRKL